MMYVLQNWHHGIMGPLRTLLWGDKSKMTETRRLTLRVSVSQILRMPAVQITLL